MTELNREFLDKLGGYANGSAGRALSMLIRPAFTADEGKRLVWGDWSAIEARVLPWLAGKGGGEDKLDIFRRSDADPNEPDIYIRTACDLNGGDPHETWQAYIAGDDEAAALRQGSGKVPELSLGFGGGLGALQAMATNYGVYMDDELGRRVVNDWRAANAWAREFWNLLWEAALNAMDRPDTIYEAGRVAYVYDKYYMGGTLFCALPSQRLLTYPTIRWRKREVEDKVTGEVKVKNVLSARKGYGFAGIWYGKLAENVTQAEAASLLRQKITGLTLPDHLLHHLPAQLPDYVMQLRELLPLIGHTHDEMVGEADDDKAKIALASQLLHRYMIDNPPWSAGLPLAAEVEDGAFYTKAKYKG